MIAALCGGVGGSKLALGLYLSLAPDELTVLVNTADDLEFAGLHVSPDLDTVTYTLAGIARREVGWGIEGDTFEALAMLRRYGLPAWFQVGDRDLATDVIRTWLLREGVSLTDVTHRIATALQVRARILPMTDARVETRLRVGGTWLHFQEYFVARGHRDPVEAIRYEGLEAASTSTGVRRALSTAEVIVIVNSNPVLSILPVLGVDGVNEALTARTGPCVAVSPIVGESAISGPAAELMRLIDQPSSALGVAGAYLGVIDGFVLDQRDARLAPEIERLGPAVACMDTIMRTEDDRRRLARDVIEFAGSLR